MNLNPEKIRVPAGASEWKAPQKEQGPEILEDFEDASLDSEPEPLTTVETGQVKPALEEEPLPSFGTMAEMRRAMTSMFESAKNLMPFRTKETPAQTPSNEEIPSFDTPMTRLAKNKFARALFGIAGMIGVGKSLEAGARAVESADAMETAAQEFRMQLSDMEYHPVSDLTERSDTFTFEDGTAMPYGELQDTANEMFTYGMEVDGERMPGLMDTKDVHGNKWGGASWLIENFGERTADGKEVVNTLHATIAAPELRMGNFALSSEYFDAVGQAYGISGEDVKIYDNMLRDSLWYRADMAGGMPYMHGDLQGDLPMGYELEKFRARRRNFLISLPLMLSKLQTSTMHRQKYNAISKRPSKR